MCGICGIINYNQESIQEDKLFKMMKRMKHRGPDDDGIFIEKNVGLGFVRLSILDLSEAGHQPMFSGDKMTVSQSDNVEKKQGDKVTRDSGRYVIVYNGEVYNYIEIREELKTKGFVFRTNTDTEVVLNSYIEWGEDCLHKFNGMWAFCIYDRKEKEIFFSRDRYGVKPFYFYKDETQFIFASEIPPILKILDKKPSPNNQSIFDYLVFNRTDQTEDTFFGGIKKLQHGHLIKFKVQNSEFRIQNSKFKTRRWYDLKKEVTKLQDDSPRRMTMGQSDKVIFEKYRELFSTAVGLRLRSDVPVGVCLSGGIDSSSIVSVLLRDYKKSDLNTFSAVYKKGETGDESEYIEEFGKYLRNMFYIYPDADSLYNDMKDFISAQGEPVPSTPQYAQYKVMELAKNNVVVTLDGQGADEQLAGYHYFYGYLFKDLANRFRIPKLTNEMYHYLKTHKSILGIKSFLYFLLPGKTKSDLRVSEKGYLNYDFVHEYLKSNEVVYNIYSSKSLNESLIDHFEYKLEHLLKWEDRNSMWFSIEARVPFLDYRLVEFTLSLPDRFKIYKGKTKYVLRESLKSILPAKINYRQDKVGFETPAVKWFKTEKFKSYINDIINSGYYFNNNIIEKSNTRKLFGDHISGRKDIHKEIWKWINLNLWYEEFFNK